MNADLLAKLARLSGQSLPPVVPAAPPEPVAAPPAPEPVAAPPAPAPPEPEILPPEAREPTPEPVMPTFDASGMDEPLPADAAGVNPPDARADVSPSDPPEPPKRSRGRPRKDGTPTGSPRPAPVAAPRDPEVVVHGFSAPEPPPLDAQVEEAETDVLDTIDTDDQLLKDALTLVARAFVNRQEFRMAGDTLHILDAFTRSR